jgi:hypothetical protein
VQVVGLPELALAPNLALAISAGIAADPTLAPTVPRVILLTMTEIVAVLQNGKRRAPGIPWDARGVLDIVVGEDATITVHLVEPDGTPVVLDFPSGDKITMTARPSASASPWATIALVATATRGVYAAPIPASTFKPVGAALGVCDVTIVRQTLTSRVWGLSTLVLTL